jgi:hypothetical protein
MQNRADFDTGFGKLRGRKIVFTADDFSIRAGHADGALMDKTVRDDLEMHRDCSQLTGSRFTWRNSR